MQGSTEVLARCLAELRGADQAGPGDRGAARDILAEMAASGVAVVGRPRPTGIGSLTAAVAQDMHARCRDRACCGPSEHLSGASAAIDALGRLGWLSAPASSHTTAA